MANITTLKQDFVRQLVDGFVNYIQIDLDFSATNVSASDTVDIADLPIMASGSLTPILLLAETITAEGATATVNIGLKPTTGSTFTADPDGLLAACDFNAAGVTAAVVGTNAQAGAKIDVTTGATLYLTANDSLVNAVVRITMAYITKSA